MKNRMAGIPKGFYDVVGNNANQQFDIIEDFYKIGRTYGYELAYPSEVGLEDTYLSFGTAAHGRAYAFEDMGHTRLMLSSDSLASCIRAYLSMENQAQVYRMMAKVPVFRCRHKKYRRWNHLIYTIFQEANDVIATLSLLSVANDFLKKYYLNLTYAISLYGLFENYCAKLNCTHEQMYEAMHTYYDEKQVRENVIFDFIKNIEQLGRSRKAWCESLDLIVSVYPELLQIVNRYREFFVALEHLNINFYIDWEHYHAIEYSSGICFLVKDDTGATIADGGAYDYLVHQLNPSIEYCYSFACSLETIPGCDFSKKHKILYLLKMDCSIGFFLDVCGQLRKKGYNVYELAVNQKMKKVLNKLPRNSIYVCVGKSEEESKKLQIGEKQIMVIKE